MTDAHVPVDPDLPGVTTPSLALTAELLEASRSHGNRLARATPPTAAREPRWVNRLARETSPYLLQHAHNPVNWHPWGDEAFARARAENKLVLLSIGYSTCHWCHVMEHESFEDEEIAAAINGAVIPVKVDREERPDVDAIYMATVQMMTGHGGWPMTVFLTPEREPIFGGTYFPPRDGARGARVGFLTIVRELARRWSVDREKLAGQALELRAHLQQYFEARPAGDIPGPEVLVTAARQLAEVFDPEEGGFGGAPKFPRPVSLALLARYARRSNDPGARHMVELTLERMAAGGIRDHVGGGFHRYSVDSHWRVPHFEKMLYDNAQLAGAFLEGAQLLGRADFAEVARETLAYLVRELRSPEGAFYSATDADSPDGEGGSEEGLFFTWTPGELVAALGAQRAGRFGACYGVTEHGNFEGRTVLHLPRPLARAATELAVPLDALTRELAESRASLYATRASRPPPLRDDKILASWNGLAIGALARGGFVLRDPALVDAALGAARFVVERLTVDGGLRRAYAEGKARHPAFLDDHAFVAAGFLDLYEATGDPVWLRHALAQQEVLDREFWDDGAAGFFFTSSLHETLLARDKPGYDGAEPAGNSVAAMNLLRLAELTGKAELRQRAERTLGSFAEELTRRSQALPYMLCALDFALDRALELVIVTPEDGAGLEALLTPVCEGFVPNRVVCLASEGPGLADHARLVPLLADRHAVDGLATAYVCHGQSCDLPTSDPALLALKLARAAPLGEDGPLFGDEALAPAPWVHDVVHDRHWDPDLRSWRRGAR